MLGLKKWAIGERGREDKRKKKENGGRRQISQQRRARPFPSHIRKRDGRREGGRRGGPLFFLAEGSLRLPPPPGLGPLVCWGGVIYGSFLSQLAAFNEKQKKKGEKGHPSWGGDLLHAEYSGIETG